MNADQIAELLKPLETLFDYPKAILDEEQTRLFKNGAILDSSRIGLEYNCGEIYSMFDCANRLIALVKITENQSISTIQRF